MLFSISEKCFTPLLVINYVHIWEALFYSQQVKILFQKNLTFLYYLQIIREVPFYSPSVKHISQGEIL